jgi:hypothetical protein
MSHHAAVASNTFPGGGGAKIPGQDICHGVDRPGR